MDKEEKNELMVGFYKQESERLAKVTNTELENICLQTAKHLEVENTRIDAIKKDIEKMNTTSKLQKEKHEEYMKTEKIRYSVLELTLKSEKQRLDYYNSKARYIDLKLSKLEEE